ncbi:YdcH family protein [Marinobacter oulmenensis]|uniref:GTP-binding protein n=1 Tax=Marinobacter oulmenensis TaxID=643747 RepID=A0A840UEI9_9GAMM|nr:DUF465 domain-containing protein [Marinobacter oulmenensis]MBB5319606.1 hypothetical protein [Marinobacter oulmenensis]
MTLEKHDLLRELPESKESIHELKTHDTHFARLFEEYHELDHEIHRIESGAEHTADEYLETQKKKRLSLKDQLYGMVRDYEATKAS